MNEVFLDTETTGLSFKDGHRIVEIACIETKDLVATGNVFHRLINPERDVPESAFQVHGYSKEFLSDKEKFNEIAKDFLDFIKGKKIIIHNAPFDLSFLNGELSRIKKKLIDTKFVIDSLDIARNKFPGSSNSLDALCKRFNIDLSNRTKHNALLEPKFNLSTINSNKNEKKNDSYFKSILKISEDEINSHKEFLKKELKKNFY